MNREINIKIKEFIRNLCKEYLLNSGKFLLGELNIPPPKEKGG